MCEGQDVDKIQRSHWVRLFALDSKAMNAPSPKSNGDSGVCCQYALIGIQLPIAFPTKLPR
uniref:Uncharacterized protein n=1 Tax=Anopheles albimanus TaxID=7167 RepID=A0A8W7K7P3_ANOAL